MARLPKQQPGEVRDGLVMYPGGKTWHYVVKWRGKARKGDTKCESRTAAVEVLNHLKEDWARQDAGLAAAPGCLPTLIKLLDLWLSENRGVLSAKHLEVVDCKVRGAMKPLHHVRIDQITNEKVSALRREYLGGEKQIPGAKATKARSGGGANSLMKTLSGLLGWAIEQRMIERRPFRLEKLKEEKQPRPVVGPGSVQDFLAAVDQARNPHVRLAIRMMLMLGLRENEALNARWEWVDWEHSTYYAGKTKKGDPRLIPVPTWLLEYLRPLKPEDGQGLVMPDTKPRKPKPGQPSPPPPPLPHGPQFTTKTIQRASKATNLHGLTPHRLRATFATVHAKAGTPPKDIQDMLGHALLETTEIYIESINEGRAEAQRRVAELMGFGTPASN